MLSRFMSFSHSLPSRLDANLSHLTTGAQLLVSLARTSTNGTLQVEIRDRLRDDVDWTRLWQAARAHGVASLVYRTLMAHDPGTIPREIREQFVRHTESNIALSNQIDDECIALLEAFTAKGLDVIPFKGPILGLTAYGCSAPRDSEGLEFVVERSTLAKARQVLWVRGYQFLDHSPGEEVPGFRFQSFVAHNGNMRVRLHCMGPRRLLSCVPDQDNLWTNVTMMPFNNRTVTALRVEEWLILLCMHGIGSAWNTLGATCDIAELLRRRRGIDWSRMLHLSRQWGCRRILLTGLAVARTLYEAPLPRAVQHAIMEDRDIPDLAKRMPARLLRSEQEGIDQENAEALVLTLTDSRVRQCAYSLRLCCAEKPVTTKRLRWFRLQRRVSLLYRWLHPVHEMSTRCLRLVRIMKALPGWRMLPG